MLSLVLGLAGWLPAFTSLTFDGIGAMWGWLLSPHSLPGWAWAAISPFALVGLAVVVGLIYVSAQPEQQEDQPFLKYTEDQFFSIRWRWRWNRAGQIADLVGYCPRCDRQLVGIKGYDEVIWVCQVCSPDRHKPPRHHPVVGKEVGETPGGTIYNALNFVKREIDHQVRTQYSQSSS